MSDRLACSRCDKRLSKRTARLIDGKVLCSTCMFASPALKCPDCGKVAVKASGRLGGECQCYVVIKSGVGSHSIGVR